MNPSPVLIAHDLRKDYRSKTAVDGVSFSVSRGEVVGLLGPNGAGKTTTINMVLGVLQPTSGSIRINGVDALRDRVRAMQGTNFAAVYAPLPGNLTVMQNLNVFGKLYTVPKLKQRIEEVIEQFDLQDFRHTKCGVMSSGEQTRVCLAKAMLNRPSLLLLDEPTASLDPSKAHEIREKIKAIVAGGECGVLWTSHNMLEVQQCCDRVLFLSKGKILLEGDPRLLPQQHGHATLDDLFIAVAREPLTFNEA